MLKLILARAQEPSTYAGLSALLAVAGVHVSDAQWQAISTALAAVAGLLAVFLKEKGNGATPPSA